MDQKLHNQFKSLNAELTSLLERLKKYSDEELNKSPKEGAWSVMQVMHHLILAESYAQNYVKKKISFNPEVKKSGLASSFRSALLTFYLRSPFKRKAPDAVGDAVLPLHSSFWDTAKKWKTQREELKQLLETIPTNYLHREIYKHPFAGRLSPAQMLRFYQNHFRRHRGQIDRILKTYYDR